MTQRSPARSPQLARRRIPCEPLTGPRMSASTAQQRPPAWPLHPAPDFTPAQHPARTRPLPRRLDPTWQVAARPPAPASGPLKLVSSQPVAPTSPSTRTARSRHARVTPFPGLPPRAGPYPPALGPLSARAQRLSRTTRHSRSPRPGPLASTPALFILDRPLPSGPLVGAKPPADDARSPFSQAGPTRQRPSPRAPAVLLPFLTRSLTNRPAPSARLLPFFLPRARVHRRDHRRYPSLCTHIEISASFL
jgi:hypothetical protein